jgi:predicted ATPase/DNA-binding SARP family transcriptional activator/tetratricopeptide (TPR) repeat protein
VSIVLALLDGVRWHGRPVRGERPQALLGALAAAEGRVVPGERLIEAVWGAEVPADAGKALQVVVWRTRAACGADAVVRDGDGYRLGVPADQVDALRLAALTGEARRYLAAGDPVAARDAATAAAELAGPPVPDGGGALAGLRQAAAAHAAELAGLLGRALSAVGDHAAALPRLVEAAGHDPSDEAVLAALLRSEAAVRGAGAALDRYDRYRVALRDRLGVDPGAELQRAHRDLVAADRPVREGLRYDGTPLIGRDEDIRRVLGLLAAARVVSVIGPGGLGKTRLAHVLGRSAGQPVVHFVELVGITAAEDLIGEIGSALGVRDSVSGRRSLTPEQRADVRGRIARQLSAAPSLLILDNCEHLVEAVADLVAFLVATTRDLRIVTTSRAPLLISAERVYPLGELDGVDSAELFRQRAVAARPGVQLPDDAVREIAARLDGLPLAIELAAAKVRAMSVEDIRRRLADRFALLRGGVRNVPDRHRTLTAVMEWSWNLLDDAERRALRRLSVFHDGFTLATAEAVLGPDAHTPVQALVDQSLLGVAETGYGLRYRMLETVREFGVLRLAEAGEKDQAYAARRDWAVRYASAAAGQTFTPNQFEAVDALAAEETNLTDVLRDALTASDTEAVVLVLCGLGALWSVRGEHTRVIALTGSVVQAVAGWRPPPELADTTRIALVVLLYNSMLMTDEATRPARELLARLGSGEREGTVPQLRAMIELMLAYDPVRARPFEDRLDELCADPEPTAASVALMWRGQLLENAGDPAAAMVVIRRALELTGDESEGPWSVAILHAQLSQLFLQLGQREAAASHARMAMPILERLGALDDLRQLQSALALSAIADGRLDEAAEHARRFDRTAKAEAVLHGGTAARAVSAELALARGDRAAGLAAYRELVDAMRAITARVLPPIGIEPWVMMGEAWALTAFARYGQRADEPYAAELYGCCRSRLLPALDYRYVDFPVCGTVLFAVGAWGLLRSALPAAAAARLLVLAERFAYNRMLPTMDWAAVEPYAERRAPGRIAALRTEYGDRRGPDLRDEVRAVLRRLD